MTVGGDFIPIEDDQAFDEGPTYPVAFGVELTPKVSGIIIAILGIAGAAWLFFKFVKPVLDGNKVLETEIAQKQTELDQKKADLENIDELRAQLDQTVAKRAKVYALFAKPETLDTLLIDTNGRIEEVNKGAISDEQRIQAAGQLPAVLKAALTKFEPQPDLSIVVEDGSLGTAVDGKLQREVVNVELKGKFDQLQSIMRNIERLEPLLIIKDFEATLEDSPQILRINEENEVENVTVEQETVLVDGNVIQQNPAQLNTRFTLEALLPTSDVDELPDIQPPAAAQPGDEAAAPAQ